MSIRTLTIIAAAAAFLAVVAGTFAAHVINHLPDDRLAWWETGNRYHMYHALGMFIAAWAATRFHTRLSIAAGWMFLVGIVIFAGSLYTMTLTDMRWLGAITPFGGVSFLIGWALLIAAAFKQPAP